MRSLCTIIITAALLIIYVACGDKSNQVTNEISVVFSDQEQYNPGVFELEKTLGYISGMRYNAKSTAKLLYIAFANYDAQIGPYSVEAPQEPGQIVLVLSFKTENKEIPLEQQMDEYTKMKVPAGIYEPGWMCEGRCFQVYYFVGGQSGGPTISDLGATGTATLSASTPEKVSGSIDFTSPNGTTIKGTFNVKIEKDLWQN